MFYLLESTSYLEMVNATLIALTNLFAPFEVKKTY